MFKHKPFIFIFFMTILISGQVHGQSTEAVSGTINKVDAEGGVIYLDTSDGCEQFYVMTESNLYMSAHHMSVIEIQKGDPVTIQYVKSSGKNDIIKLVDTQTTR